MYVKIDGKFKSIKRIGLKSDSTTILIHTITDEGLEEECKCTSDSANYYHLRCLLSSDIYTISDILCGNKEHIIWMTTILLRIGNQFQCIVGITFTTGTKDFMVITQSTNNDQIKTFICSSEPIHYPFFEAILKNLPPNHIKSQKGKNLDEFDWNLSQLQTHQTTVRNRHFHPRRFGVRKRRTHHLNASVRKINLAVTHKHTAQQS